MTLGGYLVWNYISKDVAGKGFDAAGIITDILKGGGGDLDRDDKD